MQWLNVSYRVWFNRRHNRADAGWQEVARYIHFNPVRLASLGLNKRQQAAARAGAIQRPSPELVAQSCRRGPGQLSVNCCGLLSDIVPRRISLSICLA